VGWASSPVRLWQAGRQLRWAAGTATLLARSARRKWDGRPRLSPPVRALAAGTAASLGSRDGYPTGALGAKKVGWASSPVPACPRFGSRDGSFAGQPGRLPYWRARRGDSGMPYSSAATTIAAISGCTSQRAPCSAVSPARSPQAKSGPPCNPVRGAGGGGAPCRRQVTNSVRPGASQCGRWRR
jgi:hypothetical protein